MRASYYSILILALCLSGMPVFAQDRIALVVGNAAYEKASVLDNTTHDALDIASVLEMIGFDVQLHQDIRTRGEFREAVRHWRGALAAGEDSVGLFFYAGHAVQVNGENYLIPTAADLRDIPDLDIETLSLGYVTAMAGDAGNPVNLFFVDACRDNPFRGFTRSLNRGLAVTDTPEGSIIVYAASPGKVASDGDGRNSPFTANLLREITTEEHVLLMLQNVVKGVRRDTAGQQQPWFHASLTGDFYFNARKAEEEQIEGRTDASSGIPPVADVDAGYDESVRADSPRSESVSVESDPTPEITGTASSEGSAPDETSRTNAGAADAPEEDVANIVPLPDPDRNGLSGAWAGEIRDGDRPGASVTMRFASTADGGYDVGFSRLINYGVLPMSCSIASGRLMPLGPGSMRLAMTHSGCRGSGIIRLEGGRLVGVLDFGGRSLQLELSPAGSG